MLLLSLCQSVVVILEDEEDLTDVTLVSDDTY